MQLTSNSRFETKEISMSDIVKLKDEILLGVHICQTNGYVFGMKSFQNLLNHLNVSITGLLNGIYSVEYFLDEKHRIYAGLTEFADRNNVDTIIDVDAIEHTRASSSLGFHGDKNFTPSIESNDVFFEKFQDKTFLDAHKKVFRNISARGPSDLEKDMKEKVFSLTKMRSHYINFVVGTEDVTITKAVQKIYAQGTIGELRSDLHISEAANDAFFEIEKSQNSQPSVMKENTGDSWINRIIPRIKNLFKK